MSLQRSHGGTQLLFGHRKGIMEADWD